MKNIEQINIGLFLWIWNPEEKAPHVGISVNNVYAHATVRGSEIISATKLIKKIERLKSKVLILECDFQLKKPLELVFDRNYLIGSNFQTCLSPIKECMNWGNEIETLHDVFALNADKILSKFELNLVNFKTIPAYTLTDVELKILKLR
jgi:hypothetical protein